MYKPLILAYEKYNAGTTDGWNYNGRINHPPVSLKEEDATNDFIIHHYQCFISPESHPDTKHHGYFLEHVNHPLLRRTQVNRTGDNKYFYPIEICSATLFTKYIDKLYISEKVLDDARKGNAFITFVYTFEGDLGHGFNISRFCEIISELDIPKEQILVYHGNHRSDEFKDCPFTYIPTNVFPFWIERFQTPHVVKANNIEKLFLLYNRVLRSHRMLLMSRLQQYDLLSKSIYSFGDCNYGELSYHNSLLGNTLTHDELVELLIIAGTSPDNRASRTLNPAGDINHEHYEKTFMSVVTETLPDTLFFSEKIYKPLLAGHPFVVLGPVGSLAYLKELGFKTFDNWWDESYDTMENISDRTEAIINILTRLSLKSPAQLKMLRKVMLPVLIHNHTLYNKIVESNPFGMFKDVVKDMRSRI